MGYTVLLLCPKKLEQNWTHSPQSFLIQQNGQNNKAKTMKAKYKLILGRRKNYPLNIELEVYKGMDCRVFISTGVTLDNERQWDKERQLILRNSNAAAYNHFLRSLILNIERAELDAEERHIAFTKDLIRMAAKNNTTLEEVNVLDKFREYLSEKKLLKAGSILVENSNFKKLQAFVDIRKGAKKSPLHFDELTLSFIEEFDKYLANSYSLGTRIHAHLTVRRFIEKAKKNGLVKYTPYEDFEIPRSNQKRKPSLTEEQVAALEKLSDEELSALGEKFDILRDRFLFSCYTGLRDSDSVALRKCDISHDERGLTMQITTIKTDQLVILPLYLLFEGKPERIAQKYLKVNPADGLLFPHMGAMASYQKLKRLFKYVGIPESCSFHTARHTCATLLAEKVNDPFVIRDVLGHTAIQTSMIYISQSHKTAERKLAMIKWDGQTEDGSSMTLMSEELHKLCEAKGFTRNQTFVIIGNLADNPDKFDMLKSWVGTFSAKDCTAEQIERKLQTIFNTL